MNEDSHLKPGFEGTTRSLSELGQELQDLRVPGLTILCHPRTERVGEVAALPGLLSKETVELSRQTPHFSDPAGGTPRPLAEAHLSRKPILLRRLASGHLRLDLGDGKKGVMVDGEAISGAIEFTEHAMEQGIVLILNPLIAVLLHRLPPPQKRPPDFGLVGESGAILELRREIQSLARLDYPILLRGESGTGKEMVAKALHEAGERAGRPQVSVNMGALPPSLAAAELFGTSRGAYTGADRERVGYFRRAHGGTLFLDEIGDTSAEVQVLLLRALETGKIRALGAAEEIAVDVRLIAATDVDIDAAIELGELRASLFHRLTGSEIELPPLRRRKDDVARLFFHFLHSELEVVRRSLPAVDGNEDSNAAQSTMPTVTAEFVARLMNHPWPGNVRELRNVVRQMVVANWQKPQWQIPGPVARRLEASGGAGQASGEATNTTEEAEAARPFRSPDEVSEQELVAVLRTQRWNIHRAAAELNLSRPSLYRLMRNSPNIRRASDLGKDELAESYRACEGNLEALVDQLQISKRGLQLRLSELGIGKRD